MIPEKVYRLDDRWVRAAVLGGLWASFEIVIGSFLHNLHVPFSGSILTFVATIFIMAFYRIWPVKGLVWRAGLICALMKSVSPSAVIIGPMTGIFMEALLIDLVLRLGGQRLPIILLAGAASQLSSLLHKIFGMLILFGWDIVEIFEKLFNYATRQFMSIHLTPRQALTGLILFYVLSGMLAAFAGYKLGRNLRMKGTQTFSQGSGKLDSGRKWDIVDPGQRFYWPLLPIHVLAIIILLLLFERFELNLTSLSCFTLFIGFSLIRYPRIKYRLMKPVFWINLLLIAVIAGFFWKSGDTADPAPEYEGWITGLMLCLRAILIITGFSALSTELRNPLLRDFLFRFGFRKVYNATSMAFSALPLMMEHGARGTGFLLHPVRSVRELLLSADEWLNVLQHSQNSNEPTANSN